MIPNSKCWNVDSVNGKWWFNTLHCSNAWCVVLVKLTNGWSPLCPLFPLTENKITIVLASYCFQSKECLEIRVLDGPWSLSVHACLCSVWTLNHGSCSTAVSNSLLSSQEKLQQVEGTHESGAVEDIITKQLVSDSFPHHHTDMSSISPIAQTMSSPDISLHVRLVKLYTFSGKWCSGTVRNCVMIILHLLMLS